MMKGESAWQKKDGGWKKKRFKVVMPVKTWYLKKLIPNYILADFTKNVAHVNYKMYTVKHLL